MSFDAEVYAENQRRTLELQQQHETQKALVKLSMTPDEIREHVVEDDYRFASENPDYIRDLIRESLKKDTDEQLLETYMEYIFDWEEFENGTNE
jgi:thermostable 8-oxoguanine DNA glycosylase